MADTRGEARLFVLAGPDLARSFPLGERTTLGRSDECDVVLRDRSISRKHAVIVRQEERWFVQDLGSTNGVSKDGQRGERFELADGEEFRLGDLPLRFKLLTETEAPDIEFELGPAVKSASQNVAAAAPVLTSEKSPAARVEAAATEAEVVIEEVEIEGPDEPATQPFSAATRPLAATSFRSSRTERRTGLFVGDLGQQPLWLRALLVLVLLGLGAGLAYGAFWAVQLLRAGL